MILQSIDLRTGVEIQKTKYSGSIQANPLDIVVNHLGIFMLANIENGFKETSSLSSYTTQNLKVNFGIILMDYEGKITEIESYDPSNPLNDLGAEYPKALVVGIQNGHQPLYTFLGSRDDGDKNQGGGIYITQPSNHSAMLSLGDTLSACSGIESNCELCSSKSCLK